jgi:hypothetical protein
MANRVVVDCRQHPSASNGCSLTIAGTEKEVLEAAVAHAVAQHGDHDTPELRQQLRGILRPAGPGQ